MKALNIITLFSFIIIGVALIAISPENLPRDYEAPKFMGGFALLWAGILSLPWLIFRLPKENNEQANRRLLQARQMLQFGIALGIILNGLGTLGLYELYTKGFQYDKLAHFLSPAIFVFTICYFLQNWYGMSFKKSLTGVIIAVFVGGIGWEFGEWFTDELFDTATWGVFGQQVIADTFWDIVFDIIGIIVGSLAYKKYTNKRSPQQ